ncbi:flavodoxin domain-containing protein [Cellulomonas sp. NPDC055163]
MRILVTVASRHGATREIGTVVADVLRSAGHDVDELEPEDVGTVEPYAAVVLGSAVYAGRLGTALRYLVERQGGQLRARPVWLFWSGPVGDPLSPPTVPDDVDVLAAQVGARAPQVFGGRLDRRTLGLAERALVAMIDAEQGDFRDFDAVRGWAAGLADELAPHGARR